MAHFELALLSGIVFSVLLGSAKQSFAGDPKKGEALFSSRSCVGCHAIGKAGTATTGPNLAGITRQRNVTWLKKWIQHPDQMFNDPEVLKLSAKYPTPMPNLGITDPEAEDLVAFLKLKDGAKH